MNIIDEARASVALDHDPECQTLSRCQAMLKLADDEGDNVCTCCCQLNAGHAGVHLERSRSNGVLIEWKESEAEYGERPHYWSER